MVGYAIITKMIPALFCPFVYRLCDKNLLLRWAPKSPLVPSPTLFPRVTALVTMFIKSRVILMLMKICETQNYFSKVSWIITFSFFGLDVQI